MSLLLNWFTTNSLVILGALFFIYLVAFNKFPSISGWQAFLDSFESKGGQLLLLWFSDLLLLVWLSHYWKFFDTQMQTTIVGILSAVNGAFLGAIGARNTSNGNGNGSSKPDRLTASFVNAPEKKP
jgi:hypothetical protein